MQGTSQPCFTPAQNARLLDIALEKAEFELVQARLEEAARVAAITKTTTSHEPIASSGGNMEEYDYTESIDHNALPRSWIHSVRGSIPVKALMWAGLPLDTRKVYPTAVKSYTYYTNFLGITTWPATAAILEDWAANCLMGSSLSMEGQVKPDTMELYLSALRSWHVVREYSLAPFESPRIKVIVQGARSLFPATRLPTADGVARASAFTL